MSSPAPEPATPTVAAPAPMNLAAVSISRLATETDIGLKSRVENRKSQDKSYRVAWTAKRRGAARTTRFMANLSVSEQKKVLKNFNKNQKKISKESVQLKNIVPAAD